MSRKGKSRKAAALDPHQGLTKALGVLEEQRMALEMEQMKLLHKAMNGGNPMDMLNAANQMSKINKSGGGDRQTYTFDNSSGAISNGYKDSPTSISDKFLRGMSRAPFIRGVIDTRQNQISNFSRPTMDMGTPGWTVRKKAGIFDKDGDTKLSTKEKEEISAIVKFIENCGITDEDNKSRDARYAKFTRASFDTFLREGTRDSLVLDNLAIESVGNRRGGLHQFVTADGSTIRFADERMYFESDGKVKAEYLKYGQVPMYVQIYQGRVVNSFYSWEMCLGIRNKHTDITLNGYGISELEDLVSIVTWQLFGDQYNGKFFSQGAAPKGILKVSGNVNQDKLNEFRNYWMQMVTGVANAWRTPVLESDKVEWIDLQKSNQDMQFSNWAEYLIRIICAVFKIDPAELGFMFKSGGASGGDVNTSHKQRTDYSKDKGFVPLMRFWEEIINKHVLYRLNEQYGDKYEFAWTGLTVEDEAATLDMDIKKVQNLYTVDEIRAKRKEPPLPDGKGNIILNSVFMQKEQMSMMGDPQSNAAFDETTGEDTQNPFELGKGMNFDSINKWLKAGMPNTLEQIEK